MNKGETPSAVGSEFSAEIKPYKTIIPEHVLKDLANTYYGLDDFSNLDNQYVRDAIEDELMTKDGKLTEKGIKNLEKIYTANLAARNEEAQRKADERQEKETRHARKSQRMAGSASSENGENGKNGISGELKLILKKYGSNGTLEISIDRESGKGVGGKYEYIVIFTPEKKDTRGIQRFRGDQASISENLGKFLES